jgi:hypothetical protein
MAGASGIEQSEPRNVPAKRQDVRRNVFSPHGPNFAEWLRRSLRTTGLHSKYRAGFVDSTDKMNLCTCRMRPCIAASSFRPAAC